MLQIVFRDILDLHRGLIYHITKSRFSGFGSDIELARAALFELKDLC